MANVALEQLLSSPVVTRVTQTILTPESRVQKEFGILSDAEGGNGPNVVPMEGRVGTYDIFDTTRTVASVVGPLAGPIKVVRQVAATVPFTCIRGHEKIHLNDNEINRNRPLGGAIGTVDARGQNYIMRQQRYMAQRIRNLREFVMVQMLRGNKLYIQPVGEGFKVSATDTNAAGQIDFKVPPAQVVAVGGGMANNLTLGSQADIILAAAPWDNAATEIITDLLEIESGSAEVQGRPFTHFWMNPATWGKILNNTQVRNAGGPQFSPFDMYDRIADSQGKRAGSFNATLKGHPHAVFHIYSGFLTDPYTGSTVEAFPSGYIAAHPDVTSEWFEFREGSEIVRETRNDPGSMRTGIAAWTEPVTQPAGYELITLDNFLPVLMIPSCVAFFRVY